MCDAFEFGEFGRQPRCPDSGFLGSLASLRGRPSAGRRAGRPPRPGCRATSGRRRRGSWSRSCGRASSTTLTFAPPAMASEAAVCRGMRGVIPSLSRPAALTAFVKLRKVKFRSTISNVFMRSLWLLAAHGLLPAAVAVQFRHLQETSHFAVHGVLARTARANQLLAEVLTHHPLGLGPVTSRRRRHVRDHRPQPRRTPPGRSAPRHHRPPVRGRADPPPHRTRHPHHRREPHRAAAGPRCVAPLRRPRHRRLCRLPGRWPACPPGGFLIPRLLLYPQLAWMSLLAEHTWFDPDHRTGTPAQIEAGRCLRPYNVAAPGSRRRDHLAPLRRPAPLRPSIGALELPACPRMPSRPAALHPRRALHRHAHRHHRALNTSAAALQPVTIRPARRQLRSRTLKVSKATTVQEAPQVRIGDARGSH